jgi:hypothetical protein
MVIKRLAYRFRAPVKLSESLRIRAIGAPRLDCARCLARQIAAAISRRNEPSLSIPRAGVQRLGKRYAADDAPDHRQVDRNHDECRRQTNGEYQSVLLGIGQ